MFLAQKLIPKQFNNPRNSSEDYNEDNEKGKHEIADKNKTKETGNEGSDIDKSVVPNFSLFKFFFAPKRDVMQNFQRDISAALSKLDL